MFMTFSLEEANLDSNLNLTKSLTVDVIIEIDSLITLIDFNKAFNTINDEILKCLAT